MMYDLKVQDLWKFGMQIGSQARAVVHEILMRADEWPWAYGRISITHMPCYYREYKADQLIADKLYQPGFFNDYLCLQIDDRAENSVYRHRMEVLFRKYLEDNLSATFIPMQCEINARNIPHGWFMSELGEVGYTEGSYEVVRSAMRALRTRVILPEARLDSDLVSRIASEVESEFIGKRSVIVEKVKYGDQLSLPIEVHRGSVTLAKQVFTLEDCSDGLDLAADVTAEQLRVLLLKSLFVRY